MYLYFQAKKKNMYLYFILYIQNASSIVETLGRHAPSSLEDCLSEYPFLTKTTFRIQRLIKKKNKTFRIQRRVCL